ncbi:hypothetical protein BZA05DRAFT_476874 [Tricharina praecox]|uniref:uncharacterized protein n=1 Tax=Tricharina praecox TaxID=43433 RepID=UPI00221F7D81|nr:uncharacterized protein BZA05DRAFT_476874 [Tricharina praecox]KAI5844279.1 hypothetical protein BZA05DRAFT_476874 [Tricharina praecox]
MSQHWLNIPGNALVIGAGQGIGKATALAFATGGVSGIVLAGRTQATLSQTEVEIGAIAASQGREVKTLIVITDITKEADVICLHQEAKEVFRRIDYAANTAGLLGDDFKPTTSVTATEVNAQLAMNATGFLLCMREAIKMMETQEPLSVPGFHTAERPGIVSAGLLESNNNTPENGLKSVGSVPIRRFSTVDEVADVAVFMCSPRASYIHGMNYVVAGGVGFEQCWSVEA